MHSENSLVQLYVLYIKCICTYVNICTKYIVYMYIIYIYKPVTHADYVFIYAHIVYALCLYRCAVCMFTYIFITYI